MRFWRFTVCAAWLLLFLVVGVTPIFSQGFPGNSGLDSMGKQASVAQRPRNRSCFEQKSDAKSALKALPANARAWLTEDAVYLISPEERCTFLKLQTDEEREHFMEQFWYRRSVDPDSPNEDFKLEHYRRIVFANENYASSFAEGGRIEGWKMDRGRIYVLCGAPDSVEKESAGVAGLPSKASCRLERWHYRHLQGIAETPRMQFDFVACRGNDYRLVIPEGNEAPFFDAITRNVLRASGHSGVMNSENVQIALGIAPSPKLKFKDLEAIVVTGIARDQVRVSKDIDFAQATRATTLARIHIRMSREARGTDGEGVRSAQYQLFLRVSKPSGWVVNTSERTVGQFEHDNLDFPLVLDAELDVPLAPDSYRLAVVVKNVKSGDVGVVRTAFNVPTFDALEAAPDSPGADRKE